MSTTLNISEKEYSPKCSLLLSWYVLCVESSLWQPLSLTIKMFYNTQVISDYYIKIFQIQRKLSTLSKGKIPEKFLHQTLLLPQGFQEWEELFMRPNFNIYQQTIKYTLESHSFCSYCCSLKGPSCKNLNNRTRRYGRYKG